MSDSDYLALQESLEAEALADVQAQADRMERLRLNQVRAKEQLDLAGAHLLTTAISSSRDFRLEISEYEATVRRCFQALEDPAFGGDSGAVPPVGGKPGA